MNLRIVNRAENMRNKSVYKNSSSGVPGVSFNKEFGKWAAYVNINKKRLFLGRFKTMEEASLVTREARMRLGFTTT